MGLALAAAMGVMLSAGFAIAADGADGTPLVKPLVDSSPIDDVLDVLDARGQGLKTFSANVDMTKTDTSDQSSTEQTGRVVFENTPEGASRARITFDGIIINDMMDKKAKNEYILDGSWLTELDYKPQKIIRRQVLKPGEKINLLKLGEGPFPLPIGQDKSAVHGEFDVKKIDLTKDDPKRTVHIELIPKPGTQFARQFATIDVFVDETTGMPDRIVTLDRNQTVSQQTDLSDIKLNSALPNNAFDVPGETAGWAVVEEPYTR
jgi:outer membrane lipoprotein-sorting protein